MALGLMAPSACIANYSHEQPHWLRLKGSPTCTVWLTVISDSKLQGEKGWQGRNCSKATLFTISLPHKKSQKSDYLIHWFNFFFKLGICQSGNNLFQGSLTLGSHKTNPEQVKVLLHWCNSFLSLWHTWQLMKCSCLLCQDKNLRRVLIEELNPHFSTFHLLGLARSVWLPADLWLKVTNDKSANTDWALVGLVVRLTRWFCFIPTC